MRVTKPLDMPLLTTEMDAAGVPNRGLGTANTETPGEVELYTFDAEGMWDELPPEAGPVVDAHDASRPTRTAAFETSEDQERLRIVNERAREDPAFAALADLTLGTGRS